MARRPDRSSIVLVLAALAMVGTLPGRTQGLGLVTRPLLEDLHLDALRFADLNLVATLIGATFALPAGWLIDRAGTRLAVPLIELALGVVVLAMSRMHEVLALGVLLTLTRGLGQTALSIGSLAAVGKWFEKRISVAMGIYSLAIGIGFILAFPGVQKAAEVYGWRSAWAGVGWALVAIAIVSAIGLRDRPPVASDEAPAGPSFTFGEAMRTPAFWVWGLTCALYLLVASGTSLFTELMLRERGLGADTFRAALATTALVGILANFGGGLLGERVALPKLLATSTACLVPCLAAFPHLRTPTHAIVWAAGLGVAGGIVTVVFFAIWGRVYGALHLGTIQGVAQALTVLGSAVGPVLFARSVTRTGSYASAFSSLVPVMIVAALACWLVPPPRRA